MTGETQNLLREVRAAVEEVLDGQADVQTPFFDLGLTSLALTRIRLLLQRRLGRAVPDTALFDHPDVTALAAYLAATAPTQPTATALTTGATPVEARPAGAQPPGAGVRATGVVGAAEGESVPVGAGSRVAVIGMALRFPGAQDVDAFWRNLRDGVCAVRTFGAPQRPGHVPAAGVLDDVDRFDAGFFGMSPREAELTDPAHRLFLEVCQHALEHGGYADARRDRDRRIGVYAGAGMNLYGPQPPYYARHGMGTGHDTEPIEPRIQSLIGGQQDFLATRVAYRLGLTGAALSVQTACSTSLVAVHLAVRSLLAGENDLALAGAAAVHLPQEAGYVYEPGFMLSPSGVCRAFDAASDGTVGGNGVAAVLLKRLDRALADGDEIHAVILGSAVNNDGDAKAGFSAPGVRGHTDAVRRALAAARVAAGSVGYVEAHGTGTALGDRVEFEALSRAYRNDDGSTGRCALGSVKPSVGHLDTCAGMAGLIKTALMLKHRTLVPTVNQTRPDPGLPWQDGPFRPVTRTCDWTGDDAEPLRAGVSALGFGGTNAHVVLQEPPQRPPDAADRPADRQAPVTVPLSAHRPDALRQYARRLAAHLRRHPELSARDIRTSLATGRPHQRYRAAVHGGSARELADALDTWVDGAGDPPPSSGGAPAFAFSGQGVRAVGAARAWYQRHRVARDVLDTCEEIHRDNGYGSLLEPLLRDPADTPGGAVPDGTMPPAALFALQMAQARAWRSYGVQPTAVLGHSLGELAALCDAGAFSLADGLRFTAARDRAMAVSGTAGRMVAVAADQDTVARVCETTGAELSAVNGPRSHVLSGTVQHVAAAQELLSGAGVEWQALAVDRAFHSALLEPVLPALRAAATEIRFTPLHTPCGDAASGTVLPVGTVVAAEHLVRQARRTVLFAATLSAVHAPGCATFVEIGPGAVLTGLGRAARPGTRWIPSRRPDEALAALYCHGVALDWQRVAHGGRRVALPVRPFLGNRVRIPEMPTPGKPAPGVPVRGMPAPDMPPTAVATAVAGRPVEERSAAAMPSMAAATDPVARTAVGQLAVLGQLLDASADLMAHQLRALPRSSGERKDAPQ